MNEQEQTRVTPWNKIVASNIPIFSYLGPINAKPQTGGITRGQTF